MPTRSRPRKASPRSRTPARTATGARKAKGTRKASAPRAAPKRTASRKAAKAPKRNAPPKAAGPRKARASQPAAGAGVPFHTVTPHLTVDGAADAIAWYQKAFGARELTRVPVPGGKLMHASIQIGDTGIMLADPFGSDAGTRPSGFLLHIQEPEVDRLWDRAVGAGAQVVMPLEDMFWGDRYGQLRDPFGFTWSLGWPSKMSEAEKERKRGEAMRFFEANAHPGK